jgi:hypothetical protein
MPAHYIYTVLFLSNSLAMDAVLGKDGVDAARRGNRRNRVESCVSMLTGLSLADLIRARRLRDAGLLSGRADVWRLVSAIDDMSGNAADDVACRDVRRRLEDEGVLGFNPHSAKSTSANFGGVSATALNDRRCSTMANDLEAALLPHEPISDRQDETDSCEVQPFRFVTATLVRTNSANDYSFVLPALPVWSGLTVDGELPVVQAVEAMPAEGGVGRGGRSRLLSV